MNIPIVRKIMERNDAAAGSIRAWLDSVGVHCMNLLGGAGCGKTSLLEAVLPLLRDHLRIAVLEGDLATTRDAERIAALGVPSVQLLTDGGCHLTAPHVSRALDAIDLAGLDLLIIENVGNPICPANFDLGEHTRIAVLAVTDGDDKPDKYPLLFRGADLVVLSKFDLLPAVDFDPLRVRSDLRRINPALRIIQTDARTGRGIAGLAAWMRDRVAGAPRAAVASTIDAPAPPADHAPREPQRTLQAVAGDRS